MAEERLWCSACKWGSCAAAGNGVGHDDPAQRVSKKDQQMQAEEMVIVVVVVVMVMMAGWWSVLR